MPLSVDSTQLAEPVPSASGLLPARFQSLAREAVEAFVSTSACTEHMSLENTEQQLRAAQLPGFRLVLTPAPRCHPCPATPAPSTPASHQRTCGQRRKNDTLFCIVQCFPHSSQSLPVFLKLIWHLQMHFHNGTYSD